MKVFEDESKYIHDCAPSGIQNPQLLLQQQQTTAWVLSDTPPRNAYKTMSWCPILSFWFDFTNWTLGGIYGQPDCVDAIKVSWKPVSES